MVYESELYHHGIKGQRWGVRRYQNADGSLNKMGRLKYGHKYAKEVKKAERELEKNFHDNAYVKAHNKTVAYMNRNGTEKKYYKHGVKGGDITYGKAGGIIKANHYAVERQKSIDNNQHVKKAQEIANTYGLYKYNKYAISKHKDYTRNKELADKALNSLKNKTFEDYYNAAKKDTNPVKHEPNRDSLLKYVQ